MAGITIRVNRVAKERPKMMVHEREFQKATLSPPK